MTNPMEIEPPRPPRFRRRIQVGWLQIVGVSLLALLPLAALSGLLGVRDRQAEAESQRLALQLRYPDRAHYGTSHPLEIQVTNRGAEPLSPVTVRIAEDYLSGFALMQMTPQPERVTGRDYEVEIAQLLPGQTRRIVLQLQPDDYGRQSGRISASPPDGSPVEIDVSTLVLP